MDYRQLQDILTGQINALTEIRDKVSDKGESLSREDKQTIRNTLADRWLSDMQDEQRHFFREGHYEAFESNTKYIATALESFM